MFNEDRTDDNPNLPWEAADHRLHVIDHNLAFGDWGDDDLDRSFWDRHLFRDTRPLLADHAFRAAIGPIMDGVVASLPAAGGVDRGGRADVTIGGGDARAVPLGRLLDADVNELVCNFAVVRFLPYRETGEFVNVGVVVHAPETGTFDHQLAVGKRNRRVKGFFPEMDMAVYKAAVGSLDAELRRQRSLFDLLRMGPADRIAGDGMTAFRGLLRRRESLLHFAEPGMRLGRPDGVLAALYADYVDRHFAKQADYHETVMRARLARELRLWGLRRRYQTDQRIGDAWFNLTLPFVHFDGPTATVAIEPLDLDRPSATDIYNHGGLWVQRLRRLTDRRRLPPRMVMPVRFPAAVDRQPVARDVARELTEAGATIVPADDADRLRRLAAV